MLSERVESLANWSHVATKVMREKSIWRMDREGILLSEVNQTEEGKHRMISRM